jgi:putative ABC transport system permease protein
MATLLSAIRLAFFAVFRNRLRAGLTVLGILIGVAAVVIVTALGAGARARIDDQISKLGANTMIVFPQSNQASGARGAQGAGGRLTEADVKAIARGATSVAGVAGTAQAAAQVIYEGHNAETTVIGTTLSYFPVRDWRVRDGELWTEQSEQTGERVCLVGRTAAENLFGTLDPVGRTLRMGRYPYRVIGVLEEKGQSPFGSDQDDVVILPLATFRSHVAWVPQGRVRAIILSANSPETTMHAKAQVDAILRERHHIVEDREPDFVIRTQAEFRASQDAIYTTLSVLLLAVGAVSLLVGGIGIMNIMLVSVAERTREIGIRMAVGAREGNILLEFLVESVMLALLGGAIGTLVALGVVVTVARLTEWPMRLEPQALAVALATSSAIGVAFGFFPARRAAKLDPIVALHRE